MIEGIYTLDRWIDVRIDFAVFKSHNLKMDVLKVSSSSKYIYSLCI